MLDPVTSIILDKHINLLDFCEALDSAGLLQVTKKKDICVHLCDICVSKGVHADLSSRFVEKILSLAGRCEAVEVE